MSPKAFLSVAFAAVLALGAVACSNDDTDDAQSDPTVTTVDPAVTEFCEGMRATGSPGGASDGVEQLAQADVAYFSSIAALAPGAPTPELKSALETLGERVDAADKTNDGQSLTVAIWEDNEFTESFSTISRFWIDECTSRNAGDTPAGDS